MVRAILHSAGKLLKRKPRLCVCEPPKEHFICKLFSFCLDTIVPRYANNLYAAIIARGKNAFSILIGGIGVRMIRSLRRMVVEHSHAYADEFIHEEISGRNEEIL